MKTILISYADKKFFKSQKILNQSALKNGVNRTYAYDDIWLKAQKNFYHENRCILDMPRGAGYWLWKPFIILDRLNKMDEGDILLYVDSGAKIIGNVSPVINIVKEKEVVFFSNDYHKNSTWTKRDCFYYMDSDTPLFHDGYQIAACYLALKKNAATITLVTEWLKYSMDERIITDNENVCGLPDFSDFKDHRHDQSVLSLLAIKYNIEIYRDPSQWGNSYKMPAFREKNEFLHKDYLPLQFQNSPYTTLIDAHRKRFPLTVADKIEYKLKTLLHPFRH